jgi:hypothetical protein
MNPFYDLNKRLASIGQDKQQVSESKVAPKTETQKTLEQALGQDLRSLMEGADSNAARKELERRGVDKPWKDVSPADRKAAIKASGTSMKKVKEIDEGVAGPKKCWPGHKKVGTQPGTGKNAGKRVNDCEKIGEDATAGMAQSNTLEDMDESAFQAYLGKQKYGKAGMQALQKAGRDGAGKEKMAKIRAQHDKMDEAELADKDYDKDGKKESPKAEYMGARIAAGKKAAEKMKEQISGDDEMEEGNEFSGELVKAKAMGKKEFKVGGKEYDVKEQGLPDIADKKAKMAQARGEKPSPLKNVGKGLKAFFKGQPEPMDEEEEMMNFLQSKLGRAEAKPYNKGTGRPDAHNGMEFEGEEMTLEAVSRKHFQQVADLLKAIEDPAKRKEMAMHHAQIFQQQNPRFDIVRFGQAAGVDLAECGMWESLKGGQKKLDVDGDGDIGSDDLADLRAGKNEGIGGAVVGGVAGGIAAGPMGAVRGAQAGSAIGDAMDEGYADMDAYLKSLEAEKGTGKFDKRKVSTGTVYTRKPETFGDEPGDAQDPNAPKRGRGRPAVAKGPARTTKGAWKNKGMNEEGADTAVLIDKALEQIKRDCQSGDLTAIEELLQAVSPDQLKAFLSELDEAKVEQGKRHFFDKLAPAAKKVAKVVGTLKGSKKPVDEESTEKKDSKAEKAGKKVAKDIEHDEGNKSKGDDKAEKAGKKVTKDIEYDDKKDKKEKKDDKKSDKKEGNPFAKKDGDKKDKEEKVEETTTAGSVATASPSGKSSGGVGTGIYDSWNRQFEQLINEAVNVSQESSKMEDGNEEEALTVSVTGDDVARFKEILATMGLGGDTHDHAVSTGGDACGTCGGVPCQCDDQMDPAAVMGLPGAVEIEMEEDITVSQNSPDYPTNQEYDNDALQYAGGLNKPKATGQTTIPVIASQEERQVAESFLDLYKRFQNVTKG